MPAAGILLPLTIGVYVLISIALGESMPEARTFMPEVHTTAALFGLQTVLAAPSIVFAWLLQRFANDALWLSLAYSGARAVLVWTLVAIGHVLRSALERSLGLCLMLAFLQMLVEELMFLTLFDPRS